MYTIGVPLGSAKSGDFFRCNGLSGTLVDIVLHRDGSYSVWLQNNNRPSIENFEWILWDSPAIYRGG